MRNNMTILAILLTNLVAELIIDPIKISQLNLGLEFGSKTSTIETQIKFLQNLLEKKNEIKGNVHLIVLESHNFINIQNH